MQAGVSSSYSSAQNAFIQHFESEASFKQWASFPAWAIQFWGYSHGEKPLTRLRPGAWSIPILLIAKQLAIHPAPIAILTFKKQWLQPVDFLQRFVVNLPGESQFYSICNFPTPPTSAFWQTQRNSWGRHAASGTTARKNAYWFPPTKLFQGKNSFTKGPLPGVSASKSANQAQLW